MFLSLSSSKKITGQGKGMSVSRSERREEEENTDMNRKGDVCHVVRRASVDVAFVFWINDGALSGCARSHVIGRCINPRARDRKVVDPVSTSYASECHETGRSVGPKGWMGDT